MQNIADKADSTAGSTGELTAPEYNDHKNELQGAVERTGQTLSAATLLQLAKAMFINGAGAETVVDAGSGNTIQLSPLTGASGLVVPDNYAELNGCILSFNKSTANTTTAVVVNFGQTGTELGAKSLVRTDGTVCQPGDVIGDCLIKWDNSADKWVLLSNGSNSFHYSINSTGTVTPKFADNIILADTSGGTFTLTLADPEFDGQHVKIKCDGTGILYVKGSGALTGGRKSGIWDAADASGTPVSDQLSMDLTAIGGIWQVVNEVTADYVSSSQRIMQYSDGIMENHLLIEAVGNNTNLVDLGDIAHAVAFAAVKSFSTSHILRKTGSPTGNLQDYDELPTYSSSLAYNSAVTYGVKLANRQNTEFRGSANFNTSNSFAVSSVIEGAY